MTNQDTDRVAGVDLDAVARWLTDIGTEVSPPLACHRIGLGQSNLTYRIEDVQGRRWVLRRPPLGRLLESAHDIGREHRILRALNGTGVPVPRVLGLPSADQLVMEHVDGLVIDRMEAAAALPHEVRGRIGPSLVTALAALHAVDIGEVGLLDLAGHRPYAERQLRRWERQLDESRTRELPAMDRIAAHLRERIPQQRELVLVHGDLHVRNAICSPRTGEVRAVLDWELSTLGDPLADLGTLLAYWWEPGEAPEGVFAASAQSGFVGRDALVNTYAEATGRDVGTLGFWHVLALWKIAVIAEGVRRRALDDPRNAADGGPPSPRAIDQLIDQAGDLIHSYRL
ncbi:phosphotransferase family protein [Actinomadura sp. KC216]|uniref:phosphotransferase family protein n=1 Tax=Actinomadura sp. KC216 TaxID=2530370 RepID=UPI001050D889|nr:phosphotransferase family protein [Actinomadura sp. KC216]TDB90623.1 phosphotransferase family protein [Actinomadura sp. KC216]